MFARRLCNTVLFPISRKAVNCKQISQENGELFSLIHQQNVVQFKQQTT